MRIRHDEARERLRQLLQRRARTDGLTPAAVELLVENALLERWGPADEIPAAAVAGDRASLLVVGAAKIVCATPRGRHVTAGFVAPGQVLAVGAPHDAPELWRDFRVIACDSLGTIVASWTIHAMAAVVGTLPAMQILQLLTTTWHAALRIVRDKCHLLGLGLRDRVLAVLAMLARDFGVPHPDGLRIELRLTHAEVADAAAGSRANVTRALEELRASGLVAVEQHRLIVTRLGLAALHADAATPVPWTPPRTAVG